MSLNCPIDEGYQLGCASVGGVEKVWIGTYSAGTTYTYNELDVVTGATGANEVYLFESDIEFNGLNQNGILNRGNGTVHFEAILSIKMIDLDAQLRNVALALSRAPIYAIIKSNAGHTYIAGVELPGRATTATLNLGIAMEDMNGASLEFTFKAKNGIFLIDEALIGTDIPIGA